MPKLGAVRLFNHSNCSHQSLEVVTEKMAIIHSSMCIVPFSLVLPLGVTRCYVLSFIVTRCHWLTFVVPLIVIFVTRCTTRCHSLLLVVTRCITNLSFYKSSIQSIKFATTYSWKIDAHKFETCKKRKLIV